MKETQSPCIRNCCLNERDICLGCFRHINEITGWRDKTAQEKQDILTSTQQRKASYQASMARLVINN